jgi:hypothetical protein
MSNLRQAQVVWCDHCNNAVGEGEFVRVTGGIQFRAVCHGKTESVFIPEKGMDEQNQIVARVFKIQ